MEVSNCQMPQVASMQRHQRIELKNFPPELLKVVLHKLLPLMDPCRLTRDAFFVWKMEFVSAIKFRQVCSVWKDFIDDILDESFVLLIQCWIPKRRYEHLFPLYYPKVHINNITMMDRDFDMVYPPLRVDGNGRNPFPSKGLIVKETNPACSHVEMSVAMNHLVLRYAHHLSVLCLSGVDIRFEDFRAIMEVCKHLKVLIVHDLNVCIERRDPSLCDPLQLPLADKLKTLLILENEHSFKGCVYRYVDYEDDSENSKPELYMDSWLFNSYAKQLEFLEIFCSMPIRTGELPKLKHLSLLTSELQFLHEIGAANKLEKLSVSRYHGFKNKYNDFGTVHELFVFVDRFANSLLELNLDIYWLKLDESKDEGEDKFGKYLSPPGTSISETVTTRFPNVHKLTINYPLHNEDELLLTDVILPKFPAMRQLVFLIYRNISYPEPFYYLWRHPENDVPPLVITLFRTFIYLQRVLFKTLSINGRDTDFIDTQTTFVRPNSRND